MLDAAEECEPMSGQKWGESFLKSGLLLEHLTLLALKSIGWTCELHYEYRRLNREGELKWFEHDVVAYRPENSNSWWSASTTTRAASGSFCLVRPRTT